MTILNKKEQDDFSGHFTKEIYKLPISKCKKVLSPTSHQGHVN